MRLLLLHCRLILSRVGVVVAAASTVSLLVDYSSIQSWKLLVLLLHLLLLVLDRVLLLIQVLARVLQLVQVLQLVLVLVRVLLLVLVLLLNSSWWADRIPEVYPARQLCVGDHLSRDLACLK